MAEPFVITRGKRERFAEAEAASGLNIRVLSGRDYQDDIGAPRRRVVRYYSSPKTLERVVSGLSAGKYRIQVVKAGLVQTSIEVEVA